MQRGGYEFYRGSQYQRGYGLGGSFRRFFSWLVPIVQKHALPAINSGLQEIGKTALSTAADIAKDTVAGKSFKDSTQQRVNSAIDSLKEKAEKNMSGGERLVFGKLTEKRKLVGGNVENSKKPKTIKERRKVPQKKNYIILKHKKLKDIFSK
jgi:hypothetical protein